MCLCVLYFFALSSDPFGMNYVVEKCATMTAFSMCTECVHLYKRILCVAHTLFLFPLIPSSFEDVLCCQTSKPKKKTCLLFSAVCVWRFFLFVHSFYIYLYYLYCVPSPMRRQLWMERFSFSFFFVFPRTHRMEIKHLFAAVISSRMEWNTKKKKQK